MSLLIVLSELLTFEMNDVGCQNRGRRCRCADHGLLCRFVLPLDDVEHVWEARRDVAMRLGPNGFVVDEVHQAVGIAVRWPTD